MKTLFLFLVGLFFFSSVSYIQASSLPGRVEAFEQWSDSDFRSLPDYRVAPGKPINETEYRTKSKIELRLLRNSIFAQVGFKFKTPWIARYFNSRSWYDQNADYRPERLQQVDHDNVALIKKLEAAVPAGPSFDDIEKLTRQQMAALPDLRAPLGRNIRPEEMVGLGAVEYKILRNSIFAQYGRKFTTPWLQQYFESRNWYTPGNFNDSMLTQIDKKNIELLQKLEKAKAEGGKADVLAMQYCVFHDEQSWPDTDYYRINFTSESKFAYELSVEIGYGEMETRTGNGNWTMAGPDKIVLTLGSSEHVLVFDRITHICNERIH